MKGQKLASFELLLFSNRLVQQKNAAGRGRPGLLLTERAPAPPSIPF